MPETTPTPLPAPAPKTQPRGYFNQAQIEDLGIAEAILPAARSAQHKTALATKDIDDAYIDGLKTAIADARQKMAKTGQANSGQHLNPNPGGLLQHAATVQGHSTTDALPGFKIPPKASKPSPMPSLPTKPPPPPSRKPRRKPARTASRATNSSRRSTVAADAL